MVLRTWKMPFYKSLRMLGFWDSSCTFSTLWRPPCNSRKVTVFQKIWPQKSACSSGILSDFLPLTPNEVKKKYAATAQCMEMEKTGVPQDDFLRLNERVRFQLSLHNTMLYIQSRDPSHDKSYSSQALAASRLFLWCMIKHWLQVVRKGPYVYYDVLRARSYGHS